jgi:regulatory protein
MTIEGITRTGNSSDRFIVQFDNGVKIKVSASQIADYGLYSGLELSDDDYETLIRNLELGLSKTRALRILGSRSYSASEMEKRLKNKGETEDTAQNTVQWLEEIGAVNDEEYAAAIVKHYISKGYGLARIKSELFKRGIPRDLWEVALEGMQGMEDAAYDFLEKKLRGSRDKQDLRRASDALCRRGFSYEEARDAVRKYTERVEDTAEETDNGHEI